MVHEVARKFYDPTPNIGKPVEDWWLRKQSHWEDIQHRIKTGQILDLVYDKETTDLNPMFAAPTQFCGTVVTLDGRLIDEVDIDIQVPEDVAISPQAALVTQSRPKALYRAKDRVSPHIAAGKMMLFYRNPYRKLWDALADTAIPVDKSVDKEKEVRVYTIKNPNGPEKAEIRLHQGGKFLSIPYLDEERLPDGARTYRDPDGKRWKRIASPAITEGHNIRRFDDRMLWSFLHRAVSDEIFLTHTKKFQRLRVDTLDLSKLVVLLDKGGENGFKPGSKIDATTGKPYKSFTLSSLMEANTRDPVPERGLDEGVRMPDGSKYDRRLAHARAKYDVHAAIALKAYLRNRAPDVVRTLEINSDFDRIKPFLIGGEGFEMHPVHAFARTIYPDKASLHFGVCVNINEEIEERRQAVMIRTDTDQKLEDYTYAGKKLLDMSVGELASMLKSQRGKPDALCEVLDLRKNPPVVPAEMAFHRGIGGNPEQHEANRRFVLAHEDFTQKLMQAHSMSMPPMPDYQTIRNPQAEEHLFTSLASPKRYEFDMDGKKVLLTETVHAEWVKALRRNRNIDGVLRRAIKSQTVEFEVRADTLDAFIERMVSVDKHLQRYFGTTHASASTQSPFKMLPPPEKSFIPAKWDDFPDPEKPGKRKRLPHVMTEKECVQLTANAVEYLWKLRAEVMYEFHDNTTRFTVQDRRSHDIDFAELNRMKQGDLANRLRTGEYKIHMEQLNWSAELVARMFRDAGRVEWVKKYMAERGRDADVQCWKEWEDYFAAERALRLHGTPHEDLDQQRWMTANKGLKEVARIRRNLRVGKGNENPDDIRPTDEQWGLWDIFMRDSAMAEPILDEYEKLARRQLRENPLTKEKQRLLGYEPESGFPIEHTPYEVPMGAKTLTIDVPDRLLEAPLNHHHVANKIVMLDPDPAQRAALATAGRDTYLFLRGAQSGRTYLAAKPAVLSRDEIEPNPYFHEIYAAAATRFVDSGMKAPAADQFLPLALEALEPVPGKVDLAAQTIKIPRFEDFMATVSPTLGYRDAKLTGLVIKDYGFKPSPGAARLQGMIRGDGKPGQGESGWEVPTTIRHVRTLSLKEAKERIKAGREQHMAAMGLKVDSIEAIRTALANNSLTEDQLEEAGFKNLNSLHKLMKKESFTPHDALHYGYASLVDMKSKLTALFVDQEVEAGRDDNLIHFVDIEPADKAQMSWHQPARRPMVRLAEKVQNNVAPTPQEPGPDASRVHGSPKIERGRGSRRQERT